MTTITIVEGNTPDWPSDAKVFEAVFREIAPALTVRIVAPYEGVLTPDAFAGTDGVVFTGSASNWATNAPEVEPQRAAMRDAFATGLPVYGSCNGLQLAAVVLGGTVGASPSGREDGVAKAITVTAAGRDHPMMQGRAPVYSALCVHRDEVRDLPDGAVVLAGNAHSPVQAMVYARDGVDFWGCQYHPEYDTARVARILGDIGYAPEVCADVGRAAEDQAAAERAGTTPADMDRAMHTIELRNWLAHVRDRKAR